VGQTVPFSLLGTDFILYAQWIKTTYTITFNANGGQGNMQPITYNSIDGYVIPPNSFTRQGYTRKDVWNTKADGTGINVSSGQPIPSSLLGTNFTLYAQWLPVVDPGFGIGGGGRA